MESSHQEISHGSWNFVSLTVPARSMWQCDHFSEETLLKITFHCFSQNPFLPSSHTIGWDYWLPNKWVVECWWDFRNLLSSESITWLSVFLSLRAPSLSLLGVPLGRNINSFVLWYLLPLYVTNHVVCHFMVLCLFFWVLVAYIFVSFSYRISCFPRLFKVLRIVWWVSGCKSIHLWISPNL